MFKLRVPNDKVEANYARAINVYYAKAVELVSAAGFASVEQLHQSFGLNYSSSMFLIYRLRDAGIVAMHQSANGAYEVVEPRGFY
jgi:hypothetical protein